MSEQSPDTFRLTPSNTRTAMLFVAMVVWFGVGLSRYLAVGGILWLTLTLVGILGAVVYGLMLLPGSSYLHAAPDGLTICTAFRKRSYMWQEIESFYVEKILTKKVVKYKLHQVDDENLESDGQDHGATIREETLPDTYGLSPEELTDQLNAYRRRHI